MWTAVTLAWRSLFTFLPSNSCTRKRLFCWEEITRADGWRSISVSRENVRSNTQNRFTTQPCKSSMPCLSPQFFTSWTKGINRLACTLRPPQNRNHQVFDLILGIFAYTVGFHLSSKPWMKFRRWIAFKSPLKTRAFSTFFGLTRLTVLKGRDRAQGVAKKLMTAGLTTNSILSVSFL